MIAQKINVGGIAIKPGVSKNGINYTVEELQSFIPTLKNKPFLKDHNGAVDNTVGVVTESFDADGKGVVGYKGWIKEDGTRLLEKIQDGRIKEVSVGAFAKQIVKENDDDDFYTAVGLEAMELSLTPIPAVKGTSLSQTLESMELKKTNEKVKVMPVLENSHDFIDISQRKVLSESKKESKEVISMTEKITEEQKAELKEQILKEQAEAQKNESDLREKIRAEEKAKLVKEAEEEKAAEDEKAAEAAKSEEAEVSEEDKKADEEKKAEEKLRAEVKAEVKAEIKKTAEATKEKTLKGKITRESAAETQEEVEGNYVVENSEFGAGASLFKQPMADGDYMGGK